jgi:hypothetical protein
MATRMTLIRRMGADLIFKRKSVKISRISVIRVAIVPTKRVLPN